MIWLITTDAEVDEEERTRGNREDEKGVVIDTVTFFLNFSADGADVEGRKRDPKPKLYV